MKRNLAPSKKNIDSKFKTSKVNFVPNTNIISDVNENVIKNDLKDTLYYSVAYGKPSKKKHKSWDGDGFLTVSDRTVTLCDTDFKELGSTMKKQLSKIVFEEGATFYVSGKYVEILSIMTEPPMERSETNPTVTTKSPKVISFINREFRSVLKTDLVELQTENTIGHKSIIFPRPSANHIFRYNQNGGPVCDVILDSTIASRMRQHQIDGVIFLYECVVGLRAHKGTGAILADAMGLGKSVQSIALIWTLLKQGPYDSVPLIKRCLIVCPSSLVLNWKAEFLKWLIHSKEQPFFVTSDCRIENFLDNPRSQILVLSYEMMTKHQEAIRDLEFDLIICDEAHRLKNSGIKASLGVESLSIPKRVLLTGTPLQNDMDELYALSDFCNPGILGDSKEIFRKHFVDPISKARDPLSSQEQIDKGTEAFIELQRITKSFLLRRTENVNIEYLPPKDDLILFCQPTEMQLTLYRILLNCKMIQKQFDDVDGVSNGCDALSCILLLRKLCNDPSLFIKHIVDKYNSMPPQEDVDFSIHKEVYKELCALSIDSEIWSSLLSGSVEQNNDEIHSGKLWVTAQMLLALLPSEKIVVASHFTKTLDLLQDLCNRLGLKVLRIDGATATAVRMKTVVEFNTCSVTKNARVEVLLLSCKAGGEGLNLIGASKILLYDLDWNPATDAQTLARVWRDGQKNRVSIYRLVTAGTVEESLLQRQVSKQQLSNTCVDRTNRSDSSIGFSVRELKDIFTLHTDRIEECGCWTHHLLDCNCQNLISACHPSTDPLSPPRVINPLCQLGLKTTPKNSRSSSNIAQLSSWTHWITHQQIRDSCTDLLVLSAIDQLPCVFHRTISMDDEASQR